MKTKTTFHHQGTKTPSQPFLKQHMVHHRPHMAATKAQLKTKVLFIPLPPLVPWCLGGELEVLS